jgi:hypothetical protein
MEHRQAAFAGATSEPYISAIACPYLGYVVALPKPGNPDRVLRRRFFGRQLELHEYLAQARAWRDRMYVVLHGRPLPVRAYHHRQANSSTEVPGVRLVIRRVRSRQDPERIYDVPVFLAEVWLVPGRDGKRPTGSRSRQFSISKWGEEEAFRRACEWRARASAALAQGLPIDRLR